jgi:hypothetical protein
MSHLTVELKELERVLAYIKCINDTPLDKIDWVKDGISVKVEDNLIDEWKYIGLTNHYFAIDHLLIRQ